jgi:hypothetical protein
LHFTGRAKAHVSFISIRKDTVANSDPNSSRKLPLSAKTATFEPFLKHYISVTQLIFTVAAATIAFGGKDRANEPIAIAKLTLAWSIAFGVLFCALLLYAYDEYEQDLESYTPCWYATIFAAGFSCLVSFILGFLIWAYGLSII